MGDTILPEEAEGFSDKILGWKKKYGNIYYQNIGKNSYVFRLLTKGEYLALYAVQSHVNKGSEEIVLKTCLLYPELGYDAMDNMLAGEFSVLSGNILSMSGFADSTKIKEDLDVARDKTRSLDNQITLIICKAFPQVTPSDIDNFDYQTIIRHVTLAEELLGTKLEITIPDDKKTIDFDKDNREQGFIQAAFPGRPVDKKERR